MALKNEYKMYHFTSIDTANEQGFKAGLHNTNAPFKICNNKYQKEYNKGHVNGKFIHKCIIGC